MVSADKEAIGRRISNRDLKGLTHIGTDESLRKRLHVYATNVYATNVYDFGSKRLVWSGERRSKETSEAFLCAEKTAALHDIRCDMWQPYIDIVKAQTAQGLDKVNIVRHLLEAVDQVGHNEIPKKRPAHEAPMESTTRPSRSFTRHTDFTPQSTTSEIPTVASETFHYRKAAQNLCDESKKLEALF
jgi:transposase